MPLDSIPKKQMACVRPPVEPPRRNSCTKGKSCWENLNFCDDTLARLDRAPPHSESPLTREFSVGTMQREGHAGGTPLHVACLQGNLEEVQRLTEARAADPEVAPLKDT